MVKGSSASYSYNIRVFIQYSMFSWISNLMCSHNFIVIFSFSTMITMGTPILMSFGFLHWFSLLESLNSVSRFVFFYLFWQYCNFSCLEFFSTFLIYIHCDQRKEWINEIYGPSGFLLLTSLLTYKGLKNEIFC